ncbi:hypothetical protein F1C58_07200 [Glaciihabitans sp. INWT7]|uniref:NADase-type glycan-binding domain-containing protein n=1 Tax=Glaciihabitans sp. INWT7 TaxID=2596912 RepID=UPI001629F3CA|nr:hypothetical protein [Glaciihabitans sp. INWT7]QNE46710.1 hypothetical protein F1C58_07200 [Glaciihabitans sp. INWT7]
MSIEPEARVSTADAAAKKKRKLIKRASGVVSVFFVAVVAPVVVILVTRQGATTTSAPSCDDPASLHLVRSISAAADNYLTEPNNGEVHLPALAIDRDPSTAWVEDGQQKYGEGTTITFTFATEADLQMICVVNGYAKSAKTFTENARARVWSVHTRGPAVESTLKDKPESDFDAYQKLRITTGPTSTVAMTIEVVRPPTGTIRYSDTALSEVLFFAR